MEQNQPKTITVATYDFLSAVSLELQISPPTVNSVTRLAWSMFPERIERINQSFVPNLWVNRILIQLPDGLFGIVDADLWHDVYYYLTHFSGVSKDFYTYDKSMAFEDWFASKVAERDSITIDISTPLSAIPKDVTREYIDINNRLLISMYVLDAFGMNPRSIMQNQLVGTNVIEPPKT